MMEATMAVEKLSVSLDEELVARAREEAEESGLSLSGWLAKGAARLIEEADSKRAMQEYVRIYGEPDEETARWAAQELDAAGVGRPVPPAQVEQNRRALARLMGVPVEEARQAG